MDDFQSYSASTFITTTPGGGVLHATLEAGRAYCLVYDIIVDAAPLGNANLGSFNLVEVVGPGGGTGTFPGLSDLHSEIPGSQRSAARLRRNNTADAGAVTPITGTLGTVRGMSANGGTGATAAGMSTSTRHNLVPAPALYILAPHRSIGIYGGQTGIYAVFGFGWFEIPPSEFCKHPNSFWRRLVRQNGI